MDKNKEQVDEVTSEDTPDSEGPKEIGGLKDKPNPVRYGDWEINGKCIDF